MKNDAPPPATVKADVRAPAASSGRGTLRVRGLSPVLARVTSPRAAMTATSPSEVARVTASGASAPVIVSPAAVAGRAKEVR